MLTSGQRRRRWSVAAKIGLGEATLEPGRSASFVARPHGLAPSLLFKWRQRLAAGGGEAIRVDDEVIGAARVRQLAARRGELARLLGRKTREVESPKEALAAARAKQPLLRWPSPSWLVISSSTAFRSNSGRTPTWAASTSGIAGLPDGFRPLESSVAIGVLQHADGQGRGRGITRGHVPPCNCARRSENAPRDGAIVKSILR